MFRIRHSGVLAICTSLLLSGAPRDAHAAVSSSRDTVAMYGSRASACGPVRSTTLRDAPSSDSAAVAQVVHRFHEALASADSAAALALLADDAVVLESGGMETRQEYRSHHLPSDIEFARAVRRDSGPVHVVLCGDVAWASSTSTSRGEFRGRPVNSQGAELMVLVRTSAGWRIAAIHWSSRPLRT
jgi:ketosteroid isomerase-like protein